MDLINISMSEILQWSAGINGYKKHTLENNHFTTTITDCQFEPGRSIDTILCDHLVSSLGGPVELLYSGGVDSELVLMSLLKNNIPVEAMTMVITVKGAILNVADLYYSEKFCRENNVKQNLFYFDAIDFYESGEYLEYLSPLQIVEPHVASHMWLINQCQNYAVIGGDWPWVQVNKRVLSPFKLAYNSYDRFMKSKGIDGIGNMLSHSFESSYYFMQKQIEFHDDTENGSLTSSFLKQKMYQFKEPRIRSYGWENCPPQLFNLVKYKIHLVKTLGISSSTIQWQDKISELIDSDTNNNSSFT